MRILINAVSARAGGGVSYLIHLLKILPRICPENQFLAAIPDIKLPVDIADHPNLELKIIPEASSNVFRRFLWENTSLISLCHSWHADLLYCVANIIPLRKPCVPVAVMIQNVAPLTPKVLYLLKKFESVGKYAQMLLLQKLTAYAIRNSNSIIALSKNSTELIKSLVPASRPDVAYHGMDSLFSPSAGRPEAAGTGPYFFFVSGLYVYKGLELLVDAIGRDPELPHMFIAGKAYDSGYFEFIRKKISDQNLNARITFLDAVHYKDLPGWYAHATAMVSTSWCESSSIILLEAMACGCPVVAMNTGPMPEICGEAGLYARPFDASSLASAMKMATQLDRNAVREKLMKRAAEFTWEKSMKQHARIFANALKPDKSV